VNHGIGLKLFWQGSGVASNCGAALQLSQTLLVAEPKLIQTSHVHASMARKGSSHTQASQSRLAPKTLILDNGAHTIKAGFSSHQFEGDPNADKDCHVIANCIARSQRDKRTYVGSELLDECWDFGELAFRRPVERGFVVNWEGEKAIWERSIVDKRSPLLVGVDLYQFFGCIPS
jgi:hypothetical protein